MINRRQLLSSMTTGCLLGLPSMLVAQEGESASSLGRSPEEPWFKISLAQWSLHRSLAAGTLDHLDFGKVTKEEFGIEAIDYFTVFFRDRANDKSYLDEMNRRNEDAGVQPQVLLVDKHGNLASTDEDERTAAIDQHLPWIVAARHLGCHSVRVNARHNRQGSDEERGKAMADSLRRLCSFAADYRINVITENHNGLSSNARWLQQTVVDAAMVNCGTNPDFGNIKIDKDTFCDRYESMTRLIPYARSVGAKSHDFDEHGRETQIDYVKMLRIVKAAGYRGYLAIEYEGDVLSEYDGVKATNKLLRWARDELASETTG